MCDQSKWKTYKRQQQATLFYATTKKQNKYCSYNIQNKLHKICMHTIQHLAVHVKILQEYIHRCFIIMYKTLAISGHMGRIPRQPFYIQIIWDHKIVYSSAQSYVMTFFKKKFCCWLFSPTNYEHRLKFAWTNAMHIYMQVHVDEI